MGKITPNELSEPLNDFIDEKLNTEEYSLMTENKTIVGAINEIYGKEIIANAIGEPLDRSDTFTEMGNEINSLLSSFKTNMMNSGVTVESGDKFKQLIDKIKGLTEGEGNKGIQFASGTGNWETKLTGSVTDRQCIVTIPTNLDFTPDYIFCLGSYHFHDSIYDNEALVENMLLSNIERGTGATASIGIIDITPESFTVQGSYTYNSGYNASKQANATITSWYAIGVGEESSSFEEATFTMFSLNTNSYLSGSAWKNFANYTTTFNGIHTIILKYSIQSSDVNNSTLSSHPVTVEITHADTGEIETLTCPAATSSTQTFTHEFKALVGDNINIKSWGTVLYHTDTTITYTTLIKNK